MRFSVAKREVAVEWDHIIIVLAALLGLAIISTALALIASNFNPAGIATNMSKVTSVESFFFLPLIALLLFWAGGIFKMEINPGFCRSVATAGAIVFLTIYCAFWILTAMMYQGFISIIATFLQTILSFIYGGFLLYFWLLIISKPDGKRLWKAVGISVFGTAIVLLLMLAAEFAGNYQLGLLQGGTLGLQEIPRLVDFIVLGIPLAYHVPKKPDGAMYIFAGVYLGQMILALITDVYIYQSSALLPLPKFGIDIAFLAVIYLMAAGKLQWGIDGLASSGRAS